MFLNILGYYSIWWGIVYFSKADSFTYVFSLFLLNMALHFYFNVKKIKKEFSTILIVLTSGFVLDLLMNYFKVFTLKGNYNLWLPLIWITFATTINISLSKILSKRTWIVFILGFLAGPFSYYSASKFQLLDYNKSLGLLLLHGIVWGMFMSYLKILKEKLDEIF